MLQLHPYTLGREEDEGGLILAAVVHDPTEPLALDPVAMQAAQKYDAILAQALAVLELRPRAAGPEWIMSSYWA